MQCSTRSFYTINFTDFTLTPMTSGLVSGLEAPQFFLEAKALDLAASPQLEVDLEALRLQALVAAEEEVVVEAVLVVGVLQEAPPTEPRRGQLMTSSTHWLGVR
eukprot:RCo005371